MRSVDRIELGRKSSGRLVVCMRPGSTELFVNRDNLSAHIFPKRYPMEGNITRFEHPHKCIRAIRILEKRYI